MKSARFVMNVLKLVEENFPELFKRHIEGRILEFIGENKPILANMSKADMGCRRLGYVSNELRLLWALSEMFRKLLPDPLPSEGLDVAGACSFTSAFAFGSISKLCYVAFWEYVSLRFRTKKERNAGSYVLRPDWSIGLLTRCKTPRTTYDNTLYDNLLVLIAVQSGIGRSMGKAIRSITTN